MCESIQDALMRITRMELHDIGPFDDAVLEFPEPVGKGEVVLFEGPNGCGKTTIAETIAVLIGRWTNSNFMSLLGNPPMRYPAQSWVRRLRGTNGTANLAVHEGNRGIQLAVMPTPPDGFSTASLVGLEPLTAPKLDDLSIPVEWTVFAFRGHSPSAMIECSGPRQIDRSPLDGALSFSQDHPASEVFGQFLVNMEYDRIQSKLYSVERSRAEDVSAYEQLSSARRDSLDRIQQALSRVLDRRVTIEFPIGQKSPRILFNGDEIPIDLLGEGMRNTISWLADLLVRLERIEWADNKRSPFEQDFWLILDEIEESLHPRMQARILPALRDLFPNARIYATTHSPFVVASAGEGTVFRIKPDPKTGRVSGNIEPVRLEPGQSLEWVVSEIFDAPSGFVDEDTQQALDVHDRGIRALRAKQQLDWDGFTKARDFLQKLNEEVRTVVAMREVPVRALIAEKLHERAA